MDLSPSGNQGSPPSLEPLAMVALDAGRLMLEIEAGARTIEEIVEMIAHGLGAERVDLRVGYASLAVTIGVGPAGITRMRAAGHRGVNKRLEQEIWRMAKRVSRGELTLDETRAGLARLASETPRHSPWVTAAAVGLACAAFGRLLGVDWLGTGPVFLAAAAGQFLRRELHARHISGSISATPVAALSCVLAGLGARWSGSGTVTAAMVAAILLLVPGVPAVTAQTDILEGRPTLGTARAVTVATTLIFMAAGLWIGQAFLDYWCGQ